MDNLETLIAGLDRPEPSQTLDRRVELLLAQSRPSRSPHSNRRRWLAGLAAAAAVAVACWLFSEPAVSLAQMQAAIKDKPWVHLTLQNVPEGQQDETWLSYPRQVAAERIGGRGGATIRYTDLRQGIRTQYEPAREEFVRFPAGQDDSDSIQSMMNLLNSIFLGERPEGERFAYSRIVGRRQRSVEDGGRTWREYELVLERGGKLPNSILTIRVDPETNLPMTMKIAMAERSLQFAFDYPAEGPADIYALGVPRDMPLEDRVPKDDLKRVLDALAIGDRELDDYFAASRPYYTDFDHDGVARGQWADEWRLAWRHGDKWRFAVCDAGPDPNHQPDPGGISDDESQLAAWWRKYLKDVPPVPTFVCDSRRVYRCKIEILGDGSRQQTWSVEKTLDPGWTGHDAGREQSSDFSPLLIEAAAYPRLGLGGAPRIRLQFDPTGAGGPAGSVLVELIVGVNFGTTYSADGFRNRHWLDPQHGYAEVRREIPGFGSCECEDFRRSPRGIWYPTRLVIKHAGRVPPPEGRLGDEHTETRYFLDFSADLPDELFKPE